LAHVCFYFRLEELSSDRAECRVRRLSRETPVKRSALPTPPCAAGAAHAQSPALNLLRFNAHAQGAIGAGAHARTNRRALPPQIEGGVYVN